MRCPGKFSAGLDVSKKLLQHAHHGSRKCRITITYRENSHVKLKQHQQVDDTESGFPLYSSSYPLSGSKCMYNIKDHHPINYPCTISRHFLFSIYTGRSSISRCGLCLGSEFPSSLNLLRKRTIVFIAEYLACHLAQGSCH